MNKWVTINRASALTGYSASAITTKITKGKWPEGVVWNKAPDGRRLVNMHAFDDWVEGNMNKTIMQR